MNSGNHCRNNYIDLLKGLATLLVVIGHNIVHVDILDPVFNFIYSFHMPLFIFLSGYLEESNESSYRGRYFKMMQKRTKTLLIPYICWTVITYVSTTSLEQLDPFILFLRILGYQQNALWFLIVLWCLKGAHFSFWKLSSQFNARNSEITDMLYHCGIYFFIELCVCIVALFTRHPIILNLISYSIPYFAGVMLARYSKLDAFARHPLVITLCVLGYIILLPYFSFYNTNWTTQLLRIILSLMMIIILYNGKDIFFIGTMNHFLQLLGQNSIFIYLLGFSFDITVFLSYTDSLFYLTAISILCACIISLVCIFLSRFLCLSPFLSKLLFGKYQSDQVN